MIIYDSRSPAIIVVCHIVDILCDKENEAYVRLDEIAVKTIAEYRPSGKTRLDLPSTIYPKIVNILKVELGKIPMINLLEMSGAVDVMNKNGDVSSVSVFIEPFCKGIHLKLIKKSAQQVNSAEAATND